MKQLVGTIDCEPTWEALLKEVEKGVLNPEHLLPAIKIADVVRQAQKQGKKQVIFLFPYIEGNIKIEVK